MKFAYRSLLVVIALSSGCGGGSPVSGGVTVSREGVTTPIHPTVCSGTSSSVSASEDGGASVVVSVGDGSTGFRPGAPLPPVQVVIGSTTINAANCPNLSGSFSLTPTGDRTATVSGTLHLDCPNAGGAMVVGDLTYEACEVSP